MSPASGFIHRFESGDATRAPLLLLHGTGGDEHDLIDLGREIGPGRALLSPRGTVLENGMSRFFRRFAEGTFDHDDVRRQADALADFVAAATAQHGLGRPVALGFSNGANIAAAVLWRRPDVLSGAILIRATTPLPEAPLRPLDRLPVLILAGAADPMVPAAQSEGLGETLGSAGAVVERQVLPVGHGLTQGDVVLAKGWLERQGGQ